MKKTAAANTKLDSIKRDVLDLLPKKISHLIYSIRHKKILLSKDIRGYKISFYIPSTFNSYYNNEEQESFVTDFILKNLSDGEVFFDIGASMGYYSLIVNQSHKNTKIYSFEPYWASIKYIKSNIKFVTNGNKWILETKFLSNKNGRNEITLDSFCKENGIYPDLVKIDVDGNEGFVSKGMIDLINVNKTKFIIEVHPLLLKRYGIKLFDFFSPFKEYNIFLEEEGIFVKKEDITSCVEKIKNVKDNTYFVFTPKINS